MSVATTELTSSTDVSKRRSWPSTNSIITSIATVAIAVLATLMIVIAIASHLSQNNEYVVFGHPVMTVLSGSMHPTIDAGDLVIDDRVSGDEARHLQVGQVITFREPTLGTKTHRIVAVTTAPDGSVAYTTKGDVNNQADAVPVPASSVIGTLRTRIPFGGYILNALHRPMVLWLLLAAPLLWFISEPLRRWARELDDADSEAPAVTGEAEGGEQ